MSISGILCHMDSISHLQIYIFFENGGSVSPSPVRLISLPVCRIPAPSTPLEIVTLFSFRIPKLSLYWLFPVTEKHVQDTPIQLKAVRTP